MDILNIRKLGKKSNIDDDYWKQSLSSSQHLEESIDKLTDDKLKILLKDPYLFKGKS